MNNSKTKQINDNIMNDYLILWYLTFDIFKQKETSSAVLATFFIRTFWFWSSCHQRNYSKVECGNGLKISFLNKSLFFSPTFEQFLVECGDGQQSHFFHQFYLLWAFFFPKQFFLIQLWTSDLTRKPPAIFDAVIISKAISLIKHF